MDYNGIKGSDLTPATALLRNEKFIVIQAGDTKILGVDLLNELLTQATYLSGEFNNSDVVNGVLTLNHGLNTDKVVVFIKNSSGENQFLPWKVVDNNNVSINFGGVIEDGQHSYIILYWKAGSEFNEQTLFKTIPIGGWDLAMSSKTLTYSIEDVDKIVSVTGVLFSDPVGGLVSERHVIPGHMHPSFAGRVAIKYNESSITIYRDTVASGWANFINGEIQEVYFRSTTANRGFIHIIYKR